MRTLMHNATLVLPDQLVEDGWLLIEDGRIADLGTGGREPDAYNSRRSIDAASSLLMPGLIDLHSDAIEKLIEPRPNVHFDLHLALVEADWRLATCGITTQFHAITLDDNEFGVRSDSFMGELAQAIKQQAKSLLVRHKIHGRLELSSQRGLDVITQMIAAGELGMVSLMDHSPGQGQYTTEQAYREYMKRTTSKSDTEIDAILALKNSQLTAIAARIERVTHLARQAGLAIATHDDDTIEKVERWPELGVTISEFPTTFAAARRAHELGLSVCMGAPNALRGRSSGGNLSALEAIQAGIADVLCADYYPSAMLAAIFKLANTHILSLPQAVQLVTLHPAGAVGLGDAFGSLERGKVADLILVRLNKQGIPVVHRVFVAGEERVVRNPSF